MKTSLFSKVNMAITAIIVLFFSIAGTTYSQDHKVELTPFGGYLLGGSIKFYEGKFKVEDAACYGGNLAVQVKSGAFIELSYTGMTTQGNWEPYSSYILENLFSLNSYISLNQFSGIGINRYLTRNIKYSINLNSLAVRSDCCRSF